MREASAIYKKRIFFWSITTEWRQSHQTSKSKNSEANYCKKQRLNINRSAPSI